jgi:ubiquinone/menaquinone biosynthesis C-methylase UbiE
MGSGMTGGAKRGTLPFLAWVLPANSGHGGSASVERCLAARTKRRDRGIEVSDTGAHMMQLFMELHSDMPRQGPGDSASTRRAFSLLEGLPEHPEILDVGCGPGAQTLALAGLSTGRITALDLHRQYLDQLERELARGGLGDRVNVLEGNMEELDFASGSCDLIWSEGAIYNMGFERGLRAWRPLLRSGGCVAVTELSWLRPDPPSELVEFWGQGYPAMQDIEANQAALHAAGYRSLGSFALPDSAWLEEYYAPLEARFGAFEARHRDDEAAIQVLEMERREIALFRSYSDYYGYVFYVMQRES